jgi:hypothetical protein
MALPYAGIVKVSLSMLRSFSLSMLRSLSLSMALPYAGIVKVSLSLNVNSSDYWTVLEFFPM